MNKRFLSIILIFVMLLSLSTPVFAAENDNSENSISFDIMKAVKEGKQEQTITLETGEEITVGIEFTPAPKKREIETSRYNVSDGEWKIYYYTGIGNFSYKINISNNKITNAYEPWYLTVGVNCTSATLSHTATRATMYCTFATSIWDIVSWTGYIFATIQGNELVISII